MTRERETNIIMCGPAPLKMGLMTGRASRTHTPQSGSESGYLCVCSFMGMQVCKTKPGGYFHPRAVTHKA